MSLNTDAVILTFLILLAVNVIGIIAYVMFAKFKARREKRDAAAIRAIIIDYFRRSGVEVAAECTSLNDNGRFTAVVESEPMKRFRLSHIIEMTLREHVRKSCALELEKIYWRFPVKGAAQAAGAPAEGGDNNPVAEEKKKEELSDEYINEGLEHYRHIPQPEVTELSWESFEQAAIGGKEKKDRMP